MNSKLFDYFKENNKIALAFSGGTDSSYLLYEAVKAGADVTAYYVRSQFQPEFEYSDALKIVEWIKTNEIGRIGGSKENEDSAGGAILRLRTIELDILAVAGVAGNGSDRCYHCKKAIMSSIIRAAKEDGYCVLIDGNNASDVADDRPGMRATAELGVRSPLRELGISKAEIRRLSEQAGLPTANKPAYACLATRIYTGEPITAEKLRITEQAETALHDMGFRDFRIRMKSDESEDCGKNGAKCEMLGIVQTRPEQEALLQKKMEMINKELGRYYSELHFEMR